METMKVTLYGTRGSTPGTNEDQLRYGGNTTCLRIKSECLPSAVALALDTGTGFTRMSRETIKSHPSVVVLYTHYHHDHTQGIFLAPHAFMEHASLRLYGPHEHDVGPRQIMETLIRPPFFPVEFEKLDDRVECKPLKHIGTQVLVVHPKVGFNLVRFSEYRRAVKNGRQLSPSSGKLWLDECLVISMYKTTHPEYTVSYRFEEKPTGKVFVFLTDHENTDGIPNDLLSHVKDADLLVQDGQYSEEVYQTRTSGFGHGTPDYCAKLAIRGGVKRLGITHHDPFASDDEVDKRIEEARKYAFNSNIEPGALKEIFGCADHMEVEV